MSLGRAFKSRRETCGFLGVVWALSKGAGTEEVLGRKHQQAKALPDFECPQVTNLFFLPSPEPGSILLWGSGSGPWLFPSPGGGQTSAAGWAMLAGRREVAARRGDVRLALGGKALCPPQIGLAGGTVTAYQ